MKTLQEFRKCVGSNFMWAYKILFDQILNTGSTLFLQ